MLVFTRKRNEAIMIGDGIEIRVLRVGRDGVRIGVTAPHAVAVHRREIYDQICEENRTAAGTTAAAHLLVERLRKIAAQGHATAGPSPADGARIDAP